MARWKIEYYPAEGEAHSPVDFINQIDLPSEVAIIRHRLDVLAESEVADWPHTWVKKVAGIRQLTAGDHRVYFGIDGNKIIVVSHVCRKVKGNAKPQDISRAKENLAQYHLAQKGR